MRKFLLKCLVSFALIVPIVFFIFNQADGATDPFYLRFTTPQQSSLVIGNSRAAQGLQPARLDQLLTGSKFFNYSFTVGHSPYGATYLESIGKKLNKKTRNGRFIITVDPWSITGWKTNADKESRFQEKKRFLGTTNLVNMKPNFEYLLKSYDKQNYTLFFKHESSMFLHEDGWLEVDVKMDSAKVQKRIESKVKNYTERKENFRFSKTRLGYLKKTVEFLDDYGEVYLVYLPVSPEIYEIETSLMPNFKSMMEELAKETSTPFLDMTPMNDKYAFTDGMHLYKDSGKEVSSFVADWINSLGLQ